MIQFAELFPPVIADILNFNLCAKSKGRARWELTVTTKGSNSLQAKRQSRVANINNSDPKRSKTMIVISDMTRDFFKRKINWINN
jgi:hypothetical protein